MRYLNRVFDWITQNIGLCLSIVLVTMTVAIFGPLEIYFTNYEEFWFSVKDIGIVVILLGAGCLIFLVALGLLLKGVGKELYSSVLFVLGLALYIQGNYVNIDYGVLDGKSIDWSAYPLYAILDTAGWLLLIIVAVGLWVWKRSYFYKVQSIGAMWIIAIQVVTLTILLFTTDMPKMEKSDYYLSNEGIYEVSTNENIIIFVLDAFDDSYFQEIIESETEKYKAVFEDFIHFNNAAAGGWSTKLGMPTIITGEPYLGGESYRDYIVNAFNKDGLYSTLQDQNYDVRIYSSPVFVPNKSTELVNNQVATGCEVSSYSQLAKKYFSLTMYKYMPHVLKKYFWIYTGEFEEYQVGNSAEKYTINDSAYFTDLKEEGLTGNDDKNIFRLFHLNGAHAPYTLNQYAEAIDGASSSAICQGKGALYIVENYITRLKEMGVYDKSTIIVMADHGNETFPTSGSHGIFLIKEKDHRGAYMESDRPVSYFDLHNILMYELGKSDGELSDILGNERERLFYKMDVDSGNMRAVEYCINGNLNYENILLQTGNIFQESEKSKYYEYGTELEFGGNNTIYQYANKGISYAGGVDGLWTDGKEVEFEFELEKVSKKNLLVTLDIMGINIDNDTRSQKVVIYANGVECARRILLNGEKLQFIVPQNLIEDDRILILRIELPDAASPAERNEGDGDTRMLALALRGLCIAETDQNVENIELEPLEHYDFGQEGSIEGYLLDGWYGAETGCRWTSAQAELHWITEIDCDYELVLQYALSENTNIYVNDTFMATLDGGESVAKIDIPAELLHKDGNQVVSFETPNAISPKEAGNDDSGDGRVLGICVYALDLRPRELE